MTAAKPGAIHGQVATSASLHSKAGEVKLTAPKARALNARGLLSGRRRLLGDLTMAVMWQPLCASTDGLETGAV